MLKENFTEEAQTSDYVTERNKPMPSYNHGSIQANLIIELATYRNQYRPISELSLDLSNWPSVPDVSLYPWEKLDTTQDRAKVSEPPLCVIEILSPTQSITELLSKAKSYFEHGVQSCWIVLPWLDNIYVFTTPKDYEIFKSGETLEDKKMGIRIDVARVFE